METGINIFSMRTLDKKVESKKGPSEKRGKGDD